MNLQFPCFITHVKGIMHRQETLHEVCILSRVHLQRLDMPAGLHSPRLGDSNSCFYEPGERACQVGCLLLSQAPQGVY